MRKTLTLAFISLVGLSILTACSWVKLTPEGEQVRIRTEAEMANCKFLGTTTASVKDDVAGLKRQDHIVKENLETLARNSAAKMGGDTIVALKVPKEGKQTFKVYRCAGN